MDNMDKKILDVYSKTILSEGRMSDIHIEIQERLANLAAEMGMHLDDEEIGYLANEVIEKHPDIYQEVMAKIGPKGFADMAKPILDKVLKKSLEEFDDSIDLDKDKREEDARDILQAEREASLEQDGPISDLDECAKK